MRDEPRARIGRLAGIGFSNRFPILRRFEIPQACFNADPIPGHSAIAKRNELRVHSRSCPVTGVDLSGTGEFAKRIETAAHQGHAAGIIKIVPKDFVENFR